MTIPHVDRMRKLIALARDPNAPHGERQAAKRRIVLLAKKYAITRAHLADTVEPRVVCRMVKFKNARWRVLLYSAISRYLGLYIVRTDGGVYLTGQDVNVDRAVYLFDVLAQQMERHNDGYDKSSRESYRISFAMGVRSQTTSSSCCTSLTFYGNIGAYKQAFKDETGMTVQKSSRKFNYRFNEQAYEKGTKAKFVDGVGSGSRKELLK